MGSIILSIIIKNESSGVGRKEYRRVWQEKKDQIEIKENCEKGEKGRKEDMN